MTRRGRHARRGLAAAGTGLCLRQRTVHRANQLRHFRGAELPVVPFRHGVGVERSQLHPPHLFHGMAHRQQIPPQQVAANAGDLHFVPGIRRIFSGRVRRAQRKNLAAQRVREALQLRFAEAALHFDPIRLRQGCRRFQHAAREVAVVGQKNGAARGIIQTPNGKDALGYSDQKIAQRAPAFRVRQRGNHFRRLVHQQINVRVGNLRDAAGRLDAVAFRIGLGAEFGDDDSVDAHLPAADQIFRVAPRRNSGAGDNFLQSLKHGFV